MDSTTLNASNKGKENPAVTPSQPTSNISSTAPELAIFSPAVLQVPVREKTRAQAPLKYTALEKKRQRETDSSAFSMT